MEEAAKTGFGTGPDRFRPCDKQGWDAPCSLVEPRGESRCQVNVNLTAMSSGWVRPARRRLAHPPRSALWTAGARSTRVAALGMGATC